MINILFVSAAGEKGGLEVVLLNVLKSLDRSRFVPQVVLLEDGPFAGEVRETGTEVQVVEAGRVRHLWRGAVAVAKVVQLIRKQGTQLVHSHSPKAHLYGGLAAKIAGVPCLLHLHGVPRFTLSRDGLVNLLAMAVPAIRTLVCSAYVADEFSRAWHSRRQVKIVHNGTIGGTPPPASALSVRQGLGIPARAPVVLLVARLQRWKGVHVFLDAAALVIRKYPEAHFIIVGGTLFGLEKEYAPALVQQVDRLRLAHAVRFLGHQSDVQAFYSDADIVVQCSIEPEPFGMVLIEAMACAKPVLATKIGATHEVVEDGVTGLLVLPDSPEDLAEAIQVLLCDPGRRVRMGQAGAARVQEHFSAHRMVNQLETIYEGILGEAVPL